MVKKNRIATVEEMAEQLLKDNQVVTESVAESLKICQSSWGNECNKKANEFAEKSGSSLIVKKAVGLINFLGTIQAKMLKAYGDDPSGLVCFLKQKAIAFESKPGYLTQVRRN